LTLTEEMRPFLAVSVDADPAEYPELVERLRGHRHNIVSQIASLAGRRFYRQEAGGGEIPPEPVGCKPGLFVRNNGGRTESKARLRGSDDLFFRIGKSRQVTDFRQISTNKLVNGGRCGSAKPYHE